MNNIKGYSDRPNYLKFEDGTEIEMAYGKMVIKGMLFGDRQFNFQDKSKNIFMFSLCLRQKEPSILINKFRTQKKDNDEKQKLAY